MIKVSVLYPNHDGSTFDMAHYCDRHILMVRQLLGVALKAVAVEQGVGGAAPGSPPPYLALGHLSFESAGSLSSSVGTPRTENRSGRP
jgi:uncharacterized protein (TIGR02118 family)